MLELSRRLRRLGANSRLECHQNQLQVVKEVDPNSPAGRALRREAEALQQLQGWDGVPRLLHFEPGRLVRAFEPGRSLNALLNQGSLSRPLLASWLDSLAQRLTALHQQGLWHGDLAPANLLIPPDHQVTLLDWGAEDYGTPPYSSAALAGPESDLQALSRLRQELLGPDADAIQPGQGPRLVGRERELQQLQESWSRAPFQESTWIGIQAPPGGGKTALLQELLWWTPFHAWGQGSTLTAPVTYRLFHSLLEGADWCIDPQTWPQGQARQMQATFPMLAGPVEIPPEPSALSGVLIGEGWLQLLRTLAEQWPLLLIFDDIQWADPSSLQLLETLSQAAIPGLMVVLAWRSQEFQPPSGLRLIQQWELPPLERQHIFMWARRDQVQLPEQQAEDLRHWTQGSPLLIGEWLRSPQNQEFSERVGWLLHERIGQLPTEFRPALQVAALQGRDFEVAPLALAGTQAAMALQWAEQHQFVLPGPRFSHDRVREALLQTLTDQEAQAWHAQLGDFYAQVKDGPAAFHYSQAGQWHRAYPFALRAARSDRQKASLASAALYYEICCR